MAIDSSANSVQSMNGWFKTQYMDNGILEVIPEGVKLTKMIAFASPNKRMGLDYKAVAVLGREHGVSYLGESGEMVDLNEAIPAATKEASVKGCEMVLRARASFGAISRSMNDAAAFGKATKHIVRNLLNSTYHKHEVQLFYGQAGLAKIASIDDVNGYIQITSATWAPGIWVGGEKMKLEFVSDFDLGGEALVTSVHEITRVDIRNKRLYTTTISGENLTALKARLTALETLDIFERGAYGKEFMGLERMLSKTSGTIFGISTNYSLWTANQYPVAGPLSFDKVSDGIADAVSKGLDKKISLFVNPKVWGSLLSEQTALRQFDSRYDVKKYENGSQSIVFHSQNGLIEVHSSTYVKESLAFGLDLDCFERVGSSDVTFKIPGSQDDFVIPVLENVHGCEFRTYCDVALFCTQIGINVLYTGITL